MRIGVVGAGAIGSLFGGLLADSGNEVVLVGRPSHMEAIQNSGLLMKGFKNKHIRNLKAEIRAADLKPIEFDLILLTVKSYDTEQAAVQARHIAKNKVSVLCLQNGLGVEEAAAKNLDKNRLLRGITFCGATLEAPGVVVYNGRGETIIGDPYHSNGNEDLNIFVDVFRKAGLPTRVVEDIQSDVWTKTLVNAGINPYTAILGIKNGELLKLRGVKDLMARTVLEGAEVARKRGIRFQKDIVQLMFKTVESTADNVSSMLQDIRKGKCTEIDFLNGAISKLGYGENIPTPLNDFLTMLVKNLEARVGGKRPNP